MGVAYLSYSIGQSDAMQGQFAYALEHRMQSTMAQSSLVHGSGIPYTKNQKLDK